MLRGIKHPHIGGWIRAFKATSAGASTAIDVGGGDATAIAVGSTSTVTITPAKPAIRAGIVLCQAADNIADGGYGIYSSDPASDAIVARTLGAAGAADAGTSFILALDYLNEFTDRVFPLQALKNSARNPRLLCLRIAGAGTITIGGTQATVSVATSVYTITFGRAFSRNCMAWACPIAAAQKSARVTAYSASSVTVATFDSSEAAEDNDFDLFVLGWDATDEHWGMHRVIETPSLLPRAEVFRVSGSGTAAIALGGNDATLTDNGTGDYTLTWTKPFQRAPIVIPCGKAGRAQLAAAASTTAANILTFDASGAAADDDFCALVLGFDSSIEV